MPKSAMGQSMPPIPEGLSQDEMRKWIIHERWIEFFQEEFRYFDLNITEYIPLHSVSNRGICVEPEVSIPLLRLEKDKEVFLQDDGFIRDLEDCICRTNNFVLSGGKERNIAITGKYQKKY